MPFSLRRIHSRSTSTEMLGGRSPLQFMNAFLVLFVGLLLERGNGQNAVGKQTTEGQSPSGEQGRILESGMAMLAGS